MKPSEFWDLTPSELNLIIEVYSEKKESEYKDNITYAYYNAYFQRVKKMPQLKEILSKIGKSEMTDDQMFNIVKMLNSKMGGEGG